MTRWIVPLLALALVACGGTKADTTPTFWEDVAPILYQNCVKCHQPGGIGPFSFLTYETARENGPLAKMLTQDRVMPPFGADNSGDCNTFRDARWLSEQEIATIGAWVDGGMPEGDPANAPQLPPAPPGLTAVHATLDPGVSYTPDDSAPDDYRCFIIDPGLTQDTKLTAFEVKPGVPEIVHHIVVFGLDPADEADASLLDASEPGPGYTCFGGPRVNTIDFVAGWAPGVRLTRYPAGTGVALSAGQKLVMQVHYNLNNPIAPDRTTVDLELDPSAQAATLYPVVDTSFVLPPGQADVEVTTSFTLPNLPITGRVWGTFPHMHQLGRSITVEVERGGQRSCITHVPRWDFQWQQFYFLDEPFTIQGGDVAQLTCRYNTLTATRNTTWGDGTADEMCLAFAYITVP